MTLGGRLPLLPPAQLGGPARALYDRLAGGRAGGGRPFRVATDAGELIGPFNACLHVPAMGTAFLQLHEAEAGTTPLSRRVREVIILTVGAAWRSSYELYAHRAVARDAGFSAAAVDALATGLPCDELGDDERVAQAFVLALVRDRQVGEAAYAAAERLLGREGVIAATFLAGIYGLTCTVLNAFDVPAP